MPRSLRNEPIRNFKDGDSVTGFGLLTKKELRQDKNGRDYLDLVIVDATGSIPAKAWSDSNALKGDYDQHDFIAFNGIVQKYRQQLQLNVKECRRATDADIEHGFDKAGIVPSTRFDFDELEKRLRAIYPQAIEQPFLRRLCEETLEIYWQELREHPAAKMIHHAYRGGLLEHVVSMAELALEISRHYPELDRDILLIGVLYHDLGKLREIGAMPENDYTTPGRLVGHVIFGRDMLMERCAAIEDFPPELQLHLEHLILSHQGRLEFGSPVRPMTAEALALHFIDDLDSKLAQLRQASENEPPLQFLNGLGRYIYTRLEQDETEVRAEPDSGRDADDVSDDREPDRAPAQSKLEL
ncbi:MAG: HD domain-containing protein [Acidobacteriota bacterium]